VGGGYNHRLKLDEMILIKDNHLKVLGHFNQPARIRGYKTEIEAQSLSQFKHILKFKPDIIMLDNMSIKDVQAAVKLRSRFPIKLEASGGINLSNIRKFASTGVDIISVGELTDSVKSADISLDIA
jgi:nicotinate-nucleotide pyrophosphorylase (carboxylating)